MRKRRMGEIILVGVVAVVFFATISKGASFGQRTADRRQGTENRKTEDRGQKSKTIELTGVLQNVSEGKQDLLIEIFADANLTEPLFSKEFKGVQVNEGFYSLKINSEEAGLEVGKSYGLRITVLGEEDVSITEARLEIVPEQTFFAFEGEEGGGGITAQQYNLTGNYPYPQAVVSVTNNGTGFAITSVSKRGVGLSAESQSATGYGLYAKNTAGGIALLSEGKAKVQGDLEVTGQTSLTLPADSVGSAQIQDGTVVNADISPAAAIAGSKIAGGEGSGLDADKLDGKHSTEFISNTGNQTLGGSLSVQGTLNVGLNDSGYDVNFYGADSGSRLFWDESKMALRAGRDDNGTYWNDANVGQYSFGMGYNTTASGFSSTAMGHSTTASGIYSIAMGYVTTASGSPSISMGSYTTASGFSSTAMGLSTTASGWSSTAMGEWSTASGDNSTAIGKYVTTSRSAVNSIVLGKGVDIDTHLVNNFPNSLMVGFDSALPTLFINGSGVGIGTKTPNPAYKLEVDGAINATEFYQAGSALKPGYWTKSGSDIYYTEGSVGIGTSQPTQKLTVAGDILIDQLGNARLQTNRSASNNYAGVNYQTDGSQKWFTGLREKWNEHFHIYNDSLGDDAILIKDVSGYVGIGTADPTAKLTVNGGIQITGSTTPAAGKGIEIHSNQAADHYHIYAYDRDNGLSKNLILQNPGGNIGIGTTSPGYKLDVAGDINATGAIYSNALDFHDIAEPFEMTDVEKIEQGDVVVIDVDNPGHLRKSTKAYDPQFAGIISSLSQAGFVVGKRADGSNDKPLALAGRVLAKVSDENGLIQVGDLLTTSSTPGHLMKLTFKNIKSAENQEELLEYLEENEHRRNAVVAKALEALEGKQGQIMVLVE